MAEFFLHTACFSNFVLSLLLSLRDELPEAAYMHQLLGLNLLFLLSQNRVSEFHTELERLSARDIQTNVYIKHPVSLEQVHMPGQSIPLVFDIALLLFSGCKSRCWRFILLHLISNLYLNLFTHINSLHSKMTCLYKNSVFLCLHIQF